MALNLNATVAEVTRLTRAGRLSEAMALLKGVSTAGEPGSGAVTSKPQPSPRPSPTATPAQAPRLPNALRGVLGGLGAFRSGLDVGASARSRPAVPPAPNGARFEERRFTSIAGTRTYKLYVPSVYDGQPLPLVVMLHGCKQSPDDFAAGTRMNEVAEEASLLVAYPGQPASANPSRCWNWFNGGDQGRDGGEPALIAGITRQIMAEVAVDPARVYAAGLSAGGAEAAIMGSAYPDLFAAIGVHSGLACGAARDMSSAFAAMRQGGSSPALASDPIPTIVFHGDHDNTVHSVNGDQVIVQSKAGADLTATVNRGRSEGGTTYTRTVQADKSGHAIVEQWVLHGAGHAWSGGSTAGSFTDPQGPDASREMVRFFLEHPRSLVPA